MGDATSGQFRFSFNPWFHVEFQGATVTSDAGLLLLVEKRGRSTGWHSGSRVSSCRSSGKS
jgi:hypothetical protein